MSELTLALMLTAADRGAAAAFRRVRGDLHRMGGDAEAVQRKFDGMMRSFRTAAALGVGSYALGKAVKPGIDDAGNLQTALKAYKAEALAPGIDTAQLKKDLDQVRRMAQEVQGQTSFDITGVVNIATQLKKGGMSKEAILGGGAESVAMLATAYKEISPEMAGIMISKLSAGLKTDETKKLADQLARFSASAAINVSELYEGLRGAAADAASFGVSTKEYFAAITTMQGRGIRAATSGEAMRAFFARMSEAWTDETKKKKLIKLGVEPFDEKGQLRSFKEIIKQFRKALAKLNPAEQTKALQDLFGLEHASKLRQLIEGGKGSFEEIMAKAAASADLETRVQVRLEGYQASLDALRGNIKSTLAVGFEPLVVDLKRGIDLLNAWVSKTGEAVAGSEGLQKTISYAVPAAAAGMGLAAIGLAAKGVYQAGGLRNILRGAGINIMGRSGRVTAELAQATALEAAGVKVAKVWVVNWPKTPLLGGAAPVGPGGKTIANVAKKTAPVAAGIVSVPVAVIATAFVGLGLLTRAAEKKAAEIAEMELPVASRPTSALTGKPMNWRELQHFYGSVSAAEEFSPRTFPGATPENDEELARLVEAARVHDQGYSVFGSSVLRFERAIGRLEELTEAPSPELQRRIDVALDIQFDSNGRLLTDERVERQLRRGEGT